VLAGFSRRDRLFGVDVNGSGDVDGVQVGVPDERAPLAVPPSRADLTRERFDQVAARATDGDQRARRRVSQCSGDAPSHDVARANETPADQSHRRRTEPTVSHGATKPRSQTEQIDVDAVRRASLRDARGRIGP